MHDQIEFYSHRVDVNDINRKVAIDVQAQYIAFHKKRGVRARRREFKEMFEDWVEEKIFNDPVFDSLKDDPNWYLHEYAKMYFEAKVFVLESEFYEALNGGGWGRSWLPERKVTEWLFRFQRFETLGLPPSIQFQEEAEEKESEEAKANKLDQQFEGMEIDDA